jgi:hypothetical protein
MLTGAVFASPGDSGFTIVEPYSSMLRANPILLKTGGVSSKRTGNSLAILVVVQTFNKNPAQRVIVARNNASRELVKFFDGFEVDSKTSLTTTRQTTEMDSSNLVAEAGIQESLLSIAKAAMKDLPVLGYFTDQDGVFHAAYGAIFFGDE